MKSIAKSIIIALGLILSFGAQAQDTEIWTRANLLQEDEFYALAMPLWDTLLMSSPSNANLNYKAGVAALKLRKKKDAVDLLETAEKGVTKTYDPFTPLAQGAPKETHFYLARAYQVNFMLDSAISQFNKFRNLVDKRHILYADAGQGIEQCGNAKYFMANPVDVKIEDLSSNINTKNPEYTPAISLDENALYFTSRRLREDGSNAKYKDPKDDFYFEDIYVSYKKNGEWQKPKLVPLNKPTGHDATVSLSPDGQDLFVYHDVAGNGQLYKSSYDGVEWGRPALLGSDVNSEKGEHHVSLAPNRRVMYFSSDRKGGEGGKDIWIVRKLPNGEWAKAEPLGGVINSEFDEDAPFIAPDGKSLYFSSKGHKSMGGFDIFKSVLDESTNTWSEPMNLGYPVNTTDDDVFYVTSPDGERAYFSSDRDGTVGSQDIFLLTRPEGKRDELGGFALLKGKVIVPENQVIPKDFNIQLIDNAGDEEISISRPDKEQGTFVFIIPSGKSYKLEYRLDDEVYHAETIEVPASADYQEIERELLLKPVGYQDMNKAQLVVFKDDVLEESLSWKLRLKEQGPLPFGTKVNFVDDEGNIVHTEYVSKDGFFKYHKLPNGEEYLVQILEPDGSSLSADELLLVQLGEDGIEEELVITPNDKLIFNLGEKSAGNVLANTEKQKPVSSKGPGYYEKFYRYNQNKIPQGQSWKDFIAKCNAIIDNDGVVKLSIESSASKVPTRKFKSNEELARLRAGGAKKLLTKALQRPGLKKSPVEIVQYNTLVGGPEYNNDAVSNRKTYEQFQYIKMTAK